MPELPEVETVKRGLAPALLGRRFTRIDLRRPNLRFAFPEGFAETMREARVDAVERRAKYILVACSNGKTLILHLGMTGRFTIHGPKGQVHEPGSFYHGAQQGEAANHQSPHDHVIWHFDDGTQVVYNDTRRFGFMMWADTHARDEHPLLAHIGVEPLGNHFNAAHLARKLQNKKAPLKAALLDQQVVAGLGNIYVSEALYRAGLSPRRKASTLVRGLQHVARLDALVRHIKDILQEAITVGGSTLQDFKSAEGEEGQFQQRFHVYDREGLACHTPNCTGTIKRITQAGRSSFYCPVCQK